MEVESFHPELPRGGGTGTRRRVCNMGGVAMIDQQKVKESVKSKGPHRGTGSNWNGGVQRQETPQVGRLSHVVAARGWRNAFH